MPLALAPIVAAVLRAGFPLPGRAARGPDPAAPKPNVVLRPKNAAVVGLVLSLFALASLSSRPSDGPAGPAAGVPAVFVTELAQGEHELVGATAAGAQVLRLSAGGDLVSWTDPAGDAPLVAPNVDLPALEVCDLRDRNGRLLPAPKAEVAVRVIAAAETRVTVAAGGVRLTYVIAPARVGVRVSGPAEGYVVRGRCPCRAEGCRVVTPTGTLFPSADPAAGQPGAPQLLVEGRRALALAVSAPAKPPLGSCTLFSGFKDRRRSARWTACCFAASWA